MKRWKALTGAVLATALVIAPLVSTGATAAEPSSPPVGVVGVLQDSTSDMNKPSYWENLYKDHNAKCYYAEGDSSHGSVTNGGKTVTLKPFNQEWDGDHWELLVIKGGSELTNVIVHPLPNVAYASPFNSGNQQSAVSHWIVCKGTTPQNQPEVITPTLTYEPPSCLAPGTLTKSTIGVVWSSVVNPNGSTTYTASAATGFKIADGATREWTVPDLSKLSGEACNPVVNDCSPGVGFTSTNLDDRWLTRDTRLKGHVEYVPGGLRVWTEDSSSDSKVSEGFAVNFPLHDTGVLDINATKNSGTAAPGLNLFVDFDNNGTFDGTLVYEEVYGQDLWLTDGSAQFVKDAAPSHTGGNGSTNHGTINEWLTKFPAAQVKGVAYALGSGVQADWTITSIIVNCSVYTFDVATVPPVVVTPGIPVVKDLCETADDHYGLPAATTGISYTRSGKDIVATPLTGYVLGELPAGWVLNGDKSATYAFQPAKFTDVNCEEVVPVPVTFAAEPTAPSCGVPGALPNISGAFPNVSLSFNRPFDGPGTYTLTATAAAGYEFPDGTKVKTREIEVAAALPNQFNDPASLCYKGLEPAGITSQCVGSVPYLAYAVTLPVGFEAPDDEAPVTVTFVHPTDPTQNFVVQNQKLSGTLLWPGASAGTPQQWPGWELLADGTYVETDGNFAWTRAAAGIKVRFDVNPMYETTVTYPAESELCANPVNDPASPAALPATGGVDMTPWGIGAALMLLAGAALLATRRLARR